MNSEEEKRGKECNHSTKKKRLNTINVTRGEEYDQRIKKNRLLKTIQEITLMRHQRHQAANSTITKVNKTKRRALSFKKTRHLIGQKINTTKDTLSFESLRPLIGQEHTKIVNKNSCCISLSTRKTEYQSHLEIQREKVSKIKYILTPKNRLFKYKSRVSNDLYQHEL